MNTTPNQEVEKWERPPKCLRCMFDYGRVAGSAMTKWECEKCCVAGVHSNTNHPRYCDSCAQQLNFCAACGKDRQSLQIEVGEACARNRQIGKEEEKFMSRTLILQERKAERGECVARVEKAIPERDNQEGLLSNAGWNVCRNKVLSALRGE